MICPTCKADMIVVEHHEIELDYCTDCHGIWFDEGELELLMESRDLTQATDFIAGILSHPKAKTKEKTRRCPVGGEKMKKVCLGHDREILIDACEEGHGLWFDGGEVMQFLKHLAQAHGVALDPEDQVMGYLGEVIQAPE
jgi:Zn-finger nucleic acid-binding protein